MKQPEEDVALSPGGRYMVEPKRYELHLSTGKEIKQVSLHRRVMTLPALTLYLQKSLCSDHKAVNYVNTSQAHLTSTGIGAVACARHGCFFPNSVVDFQKGER
jgi:ABC-type arginine transport system ATPase subunit